MGKYFKNKNKIKSDYTIIATEVKNLIDGHNCSLLNGRVCKLLF